MSSARPGSGNAWAADPCKPFARHRRALPPCAAAATLVSATLCLVGLHLHVCLSLSVSITPGPSV